MSSLRLHHDLLSDTPRLRSMQRALAEAVHAGDVVVDLGAGTGILGFMAVRAGASRVYAIERDPILSLARSLAAENGVQDRMRFIRADSRRVRLPEKADVVVSDVVGRWGVDPEMSEVVADARRFLKRGGRFVPKRSEIWFAPVRAPGIYRRHARPGLGFGVRLKAFHDLAANRMAVLRDLPRGLAAPLRRSTAFDFERDHARFPLRMRGTFRVGRGTIHGLVAAVRVYLTPSVRMCGRGVEWNPIFLPIARPIKARAGDRIACEVVIHDAANIEWAVGECRQSSLLAR